MNASQSDFSVFGGRSITRRQGDGLPTAMNISVTGHFMLD
jgi:hypothetical protein